MNNEFVVDTSKWSTEIWESWIIEQNNKTKEIYKIRPADMISAYRRELGYSKEYHGREILELIQNADDAGESSVDSRVKIILSEEGLIVGNTGNAFSEKGVLSLLISDKSPKLLDKTNYIGNKGLGFRSVLNWTDNPIILSGNLALSFSREIAESWLKQLLLESEVVKEEVEDFMSRIGSNYPIATLSIPSILDQDLHDNRFNANFVLVWDSAKQLQREGYNTIIGIPFISERSYLEVQDQLDEFKEEVLLFLKKITIIEIITPDKNCTWTVKRDKEITVVNSESGLTTWEIYTDADFIPDHLLSRDQLSPPKYEIKLAVTENSEGKGYLYSFFPTRVRLPFPFIVHITMELTNNRQGILESDVNKFLSLRLAEFIASIAEKQDHRIDTWSSIRFISHSGDIDPLLLQYGFHKHLISEAKKLRLVPNTLGLPNKPDDVFLLKGPIHNLVPMHEFEDIVPWTVEKNIRNIIEHLEVPLMTDEQLMERLNRISPSLSIEQRAELITGLILTNSISNYFIPNLLIDQDQNIITSNVVSFFPPVEASNFSLPSWMSIKILNIELISELRKTFNVSSIRELVGKLRTSFKVNDYNFRELSMAIISRINTRILEDPNNEMRYRIITFQAIYNLYKQSGREGTLSGDRINLLLPTKTNKLINADKLYFGEEYKCGILMEALLGNVKTDYFVAAPCELFENGIESEDDLVPFLKWLGVEVMPRTISLRNYVDRDFSDYVVSKFSEILTFEDTNYSIERCNFKSQTVFNLTSIEFVKDILRSATSEAILAWISVDERLENWRRRGDQQARIYASPPPMRKWRAIKGQLISSYVIWLLENSQWLPTSDGEKSAPNICIITSTNTEVMKTILKSPMIKSDHPLFFQLNIDKKSLRSSLERVGVSTSLEELSSEDYYRILCDMPRLDPKGLSARSIYRTILTNIDSNDIQNGPYKEQFFKVGKLFGRRGQETGYLDLKELNYIDTAIIPEMILKEMALFEMDRKRGAPKVNKVFGVKSLEAKGIVIDIQTFIEHPRTEEFAFESSKLKPYILAIRIAEASNISAKMLRELNFKLCRNVVAVAKVGDKSISLDLNEGEIIVCENTAYLKGDSTEDCKILSDVILADAVGEIYASLWSLARGSDFARIAACPSNQRIVLLSKILGIDAESYFNEANKRLTGQEISTVDESEMWVEPATNNPVTETLINAAINPNTEQPIDNRKIGMVSPIQVEEKLHIPSQPHRKIVKRITSTISLNKTGSTGYFVADFARCQEIALNFEESEGQGRFALPVDHIQGEKAYGCDILSFATNQDREMFKKNGELSLVERFIEVKGSTNEKGIVVLRGNELASAQKHYMKYYLYRVFQTQIYGYYELMVLPNPLDSNYKAAYEIDLFRSSSSKKWSILETADESNEQTSE
jgi:hypothetical protein